MESLNMTNASHATSRRTLLKTMAASTALGALPAAFAQAQTTSKLKFQLDWRFEGPSALFLTGEARGYYKAEGLDVTIDAGNGSAGSVNRVASGAYDMGFADISALMEFLGNNPGAKVQAVFLLYSASPAAVFSMKKSGINKPADLMGKKLGAPVFDAGRKAFPIFAKANKIDLQKIQWQSMDPPLRETMLVKGDVDAITGFYFTSLLNLIARGAKEEDISTMLYPANGVDLYSNVVIVNTDFAAQNPNAVKGFLRGLCKGVKDVVSNPDSTIAYVKARDGLINEDLEKRRLRLAVEGVVNTAEAKKNGIGLPDPIKLQRNMGQMADAFQMKLVPGANIVFNAAYMPELAARKIL
jgi:NitT/TauT family transport system substrate-binding protein